MSWNLEEAISYYKSQGAPGDQQMILALLQEVQQEEGGSIPRAALSAIAQAYGIKESLLHALMKRIPSLRLADTHCLELCSGPNCAKHARLASLAEKLRKAAPETCTVKFVPCMRLCGKGPNVRWDGKIYHRANEALLRRLMEES